MEERIINTPHTLFSENRNKLTLTGVKDVECFNEEMIKIETDCGTLNITGKELQVTKLDLQGGDVNVEGNIISFTYEDTFRKNGSLFARMFS